MNNLKSNLNYYHSYFRGIHDVFNFKSAKEVSLGLLKIISGFSLFIPIIFGVGYLITRKRLNDLQSLNLRVSKELGSSSNNKNLTSIDLIKFLSAKVLDNDKVHFEAGFRMLSQGAQKDFFALMDSQGALVNALSYVPNGISELSVGFSKNLQKEAMEKTVKKLCDFKQLHTITFDLSQTTYLSKGVENLIKKGLSMMNRNVMFEGGLDVNFTLEGDSVAISGGNYPNKHLPMTCIINGLVNRLMKETPLATIKFNFIEEQGNLHPVSIVNPLRLQKVPASVEPKASLNYVQPFKDKPAEDKWILFI
jgi:hypothetical protein